MLDYNKIQEIEKKFENIITGQSYYNLKKARKRLYNSKGLANLKKALRLYIKDLRELEKAI